MSVLDHLRNFMLFPLFGFSYGVGHFWEVNFSVVVFLFPQWFCILKV